MRTDWKQADLAWTNEGDFMVSEGMIVDTKNQAAMHLYQSIRERISSVRGEWLFFPEIGTDMGRIIGRPVNANILEEIKQSISDALTADGFMSIGEFLLTAELNGDRGASLTLSVRHKRVDSQMKIAFNYDLRQNRITFRRV